jgi:hypothetical protein
VAEQGRAAGRRAPWDPGDDATLVTANQLRDVVEWLTQAGHRRPA